MSDLEADHTLESLKLSRDAVIEFDDATHGIRLLFVTLIIALMTITGIVLAFPDFSDKVTFMYIAATAVVVLTILFWLLDNRYRTYLRVAAAVCRELERNLKSKQKTIWISTELDIYNTSEKKPVYENAMGRRIENAFQKVVDAPYDALYLSISLGSIVVLAMISYNGDYLFDLKNILWVTSLMILFLIFWGLVRWNDRSVDAWIRDKYKVKEIKK